MSNKSTILAFRETTLGEIARKDSHGIVDGPFGSNLRASEYISYGIPVIRGSNLSLGLERFHTKDYVFVSKETANRLSRSLCQPDDIIFTKKGTLGQTGIIPQTEPYKIFLLSSNQMKLTVDPKIANPLFVYYYVSSPASRERIIREAMTTGVPKINLEYLRRFPISLPPLPTQKKIAGILSAYDDLIENNTRRIKILEEMAQTLYHEWFVKFRFPGHEHTKMVDSELGLIPEGWEVKKLGDAIQFTNGKAIKALEEGNYPVYGSNGIIGWTDKAKYKNGIVIGRVGAYCGSLVYSKFGFWASDNTIVAESSNQKFGIELSFFVLQDINLRRYAGGSAQPLLTQTVIKEIPVIIPDIATHKKFQTILQNIWAFKINLLNKNSNLRQTRDLLLPKLISGEIDVEHLDITTEDIAA